MMAGYTQFKYLLLHGATMVEYSVHFYRYKFTRVLLDGAKLVKSETANGRSGSL